MTGTHPAGPTGGTTRVGPADAAACGAAGSLGLAATPAFCGMALLTGVLGGGPVDIVCAAGHGSALNGMVPMYLLMGVFHASPWLTLVSGRRCVPDGHVRTLAGAVR